VPFEVEMKFPLPIGAEFASLGEGLTLRPLGTKFQQDRYFNHPSRDFAQTDEALRLRDEDGVVHITYKGPKIDSASKTREEIEIPLGLKAHDQEPLGRLLAKLGFREVAVVTKRRQEFSLAWEGREVTVSLDQVDEVGEYLELEIVAQAEDVPAVRDSLGRLAERWGLGPSERRSYLELLLARGRSS
jgi:adenylate cyclase class 2